MEMMKTIFTPGDPKDILQLTRYILEDKHGFELCVHTRNFIGGTAIATNITLAVQKSRRTIVLLTQYVLDCYNCLGALTFGKLKKVIREFINTHIDTS